MQYTSIGGVLNQAATGRTAEAFKNLNAHFVTAPEPELRFAGYVYYF